MSGGNEEPIIIGLAIAVIVGIGIVCLMDALRNKLK
jgi:capsular polysaccharide biosynthesis protein